MKLDTINETRLTALEKWKEYTQAEKATKDPLYRDMRKVYHQLKNGKKVIDIFKVIQKGGVHEDFKPKLAIAKASTKKIHCEYFQDGKVKFLNDKGKELNSDVVLNKCLPPFNLQDRWRHQSLAAPVPIIPPRFRPSILTDDYYILWEVDVWEMVPPTDPWLLKRITKNLFVALAGWDLTEVEKAVMAGRMF